MKKSLPYIVIIFGILAYSYFNYNSRSNCVDTINDYRLEQDLIQIFHLKEMHFNLFDHALDDKRSMNYMFLDTSNFFFDDHTHYTAYVQKWIDPCDLSTKYNLSVERRGDTYLITGYDLMWVQEYKDTLSISEIDNTIFAVTDEWIQNNY